MAIAVTQSRFRFRTDTGTVDGTPTWGAGENVNWIPTPVQHGVPFRIRFEVYNNGSTSTGAVAWTITARKNGLGGYTTVTATRTDGIQTSTAACTDADNTALAVARLTSDATPGTPTWVNGQLDKTGTTGNITLGVGNVAAQVTELEFCLILPQGGASNSDYFDLRVQRGSTALETYSVLPRITVTEPAVTNLATGAAAFGTPTLVSVWPPNSWFWSPDDQQTVGIDFAVTFPGTSVSVPAPPATTGDLILCVILVDAGTGTSVDTGAISPPDGSWHAIDSGNLASGSQGNMRRWIGYKVATASEPASYTFTWTSTANYLVWANTFTPPATGSVHFDAVATQNTFSSGSTTVNTPVLSGLAASNEFCVVVFLTQGGNNPYSASATLSTIYDSNGQNGDYGEILVAALNPNTTNSVSARTISFGPFGSDSSIAVIGFNPQLGGTTNALSAISLAAGSAVLGIPSLASVYHFTATNLASGGAGFALPGIGVPLVATSIASAAASVPTATFNVSHNLSATNLASGAAALGTPAFNQKDVLTTSGIASQAAGINSALMAYNENAVSIASGAATLGSPALATTYPFTATNLASKAAGIPLVSQVPNLDIPSPFDYGTTSPGLDTALPALTVLSGIALSATSLASTADFIGKPAIQQTGQMQPVGIASQAANIPQPQFVQFNVFTATDLATGASTIDATWLTTLWIPLPIGVTLSSVDAKIAQRNAAITGLSAGLGVWPSASQVLTLKGSIAVAEASVLAKATLAYTLTAAMQAVPTFTVRESNLISPRLINLRPTAVLTADIRNAQFDYEVFAVASIFTAQEFQAVALVAKQIPAARLTSKAALRLKANNAISAETNLQADIAKLASVAWDASATLTSGSGVAVQLPIMIGARAALAPSAVLRASAVPQLAALTLVPAAHLVAVGGLRFSNSANVASGAFFGGAAYVNKAGEVNLAPSSVLYSLFNIVFGARTLLAPTAGFTGVATSTHFDSTHVSVNGVLASSALLRETARALLAPLPALSSNLTQRFAPPKTTLAPSVNLASTLFSIPKFAELWAAQTHLTAATKFMFGPHLVLPVQSVINTHASIVTTGIKNVLLTAATAAAITERMRLLQPPIVTHTDATISATSKVYSHPVLRLVNNASLSAGTPIMLDAMRSRLGNAAALYSGAAQAATAESFMSGASGLHGKLLIGNSTVASFRAGCFISVRAHIHRTREISAMITAKQTRNQIVAQGNLFVEID